MIEISEIDKMSPDDPEFEKKLASEIEKFKESKHGLVLYTTNELDPNEPFCGSVLAFEKRMSAHAYFLFYGSLRARVTAEWGEEVVKAVDKMCDDAGKNTANIPDTSNTTKH